MITDQFPFWIFCICNSEWNNWLCPHFLRTVEDAHRYTQSYVTTDHIKTNSNKNDCTVSSGTLSAGTDKCGRETRGRGQVRKGVPPDAAPIASIPFGPVDVGVRAGAELGLPFSSRSTLPLAKLLLVFASLPPPPPSSAMFSLLVSDSIPLPGRTMATETVISLCCWGWDVGEDCSSSWVDLGRSSWGVKRRSIVYLFEFKWSKQPNEFWNSVNIVAVYSNNGHYIWVLLQCWS